MSAQILSMPFSEYAAIEAMNWSRLKAGHKSMRHLRHALDDTTDGDTTSRTVLRAIHSAALEPAAFAEDFVIYPGAMRRGKEWEAFKAAHEGKDILIESEANARRNEHAQVLAVAAAIHACEPAARLLDGAEVERVILWTDAETGVPCKARLDVYSPGSHIADLKGYGTTEERQVAKLLGNHLAYGQLAWYRSAVLALTGKTLPCYLVPYETRQPHDVAVFRVDEDWLQPGRDLCRKLLSDYAWALQTGRWDGRHNNVVDLPTPPPWVNPNVKDFQIIQESDGD